MAVQGSSLTIAGIRDSLEDGADIISQERKTGRFQRSIDLPSEVDNTDGTAHLREGVLVLHLPKAAQDA